MAATLKVDTIQNASSATANITLDTAGNATVGNTLVMGSSFLRNRIINGDMRIDQRNAGASGTAVGYTVDRWQLNASLSTKGTWQQNAASVTPPAGFVNYLGFTSNSSYSVGSGDYFAFTQAIEGLNVSDLSWGSANAKTVTLSFWVRSSLTGTFGGSLTNSAPNRSYPFSYSISAANTWEQKSITVAGDTSGTWLTTNGIGIVLNLAFGVGTTFSGTAGSWAGANYVTATGATSVVGTNGATFYITGVQLEVGSVATPFERRQYGQELALCQRYCQVYGRGKGYSNSTIDQYYGNRYTSNQVLATIPSPVTMRTAPTATAIGTVKFTVYDVVGSDTNATLSSVLGVSYNAIQLILSTTLGPSDNPITGYIVTSTTGYIFSAEL